MPRYIDATRDITEKDEAIKRYQQLAGLKAERQIKAEQEGSKGILSAFATGLLALITFIIIIYLGTK